MPLILHVVERATPSFQSVRSLVDVVCGGDSITGWNNFGAVGDWPYPTYPEFLGRLCEPSGLTVANGGIAGEVSPSGVGQVRDYLDLFPIARYLVVGYGTNDLGMWPLFLPIDQISANHKDNLKASHARLIAPTSFSIEIDRLTKARSVCLGLSFANNRSGRS